MDIWVPKTSFSKMYIFGAPIESEGPGMVSLNSSKARAVRGLDNQDVVHYSSYILYILGMYLAVSQSQ